MHVEALRAIAEQIRLNTLAQLESADHAEEIRKVLEAMNARLPVLPLCGPGYALLMIGYFFEGSKFVGRNIRP